MAYALGDASLGAGGAAVFITHVEAGPVALLAAGNRNEVVPVFTAVRLPKEEPGSTPAASPRVRRRPSPWPPRPASKPSPEDPRHPCTPSGKAPRPAPIRQVRAGNQFEGRNNAGSSRTPLRLARRTRAIWQCWPVPALSGLLPPSPAPPGSGCPQLQPPGATGRRWRSLSPNTKQQRLTAHLLSRLLTGTQRPGPRILTSIYCVIFKAGEIHFHYPCEDEECGSNSANPYQDIPNSIPMHQSVVCLKFKGEGKYHTSRKKKYYSNELVEYVCGGGLSPFGKQSQVTTVLVLQALPYPANHFQIVAVQTCLRLRNIWRRGLATGRLGTTRHKAGRLQGRV